MSDVDYNALFVNGQLVMDEPTHLVVLDRMYQSYKGYPEEEIFKNKYPAYLSKFHPLTTMPIIDPPVEPTVTPVEVTQEPVPETIIDAVVEEDMGVPVQEELPAAPIEVSPL